MLSIATCIFYQLNNRSVQIRLFPFIFISKLNKTDEVTEALALPTLSYSPFTVFIFSTNLQLLLFGHPVVSNSLRPHGLQHARISISISVTQPRISISISVAHDNSIILTLYCIYFRYSSRKSISISVISLQRFPLL